MKILDELEYAENIFKNGFSKNRIVFDMKMLGKYFRSEGFEKEQLKIKLIEFCKNNIPQFNEITWYKSINSICKYAEKNNLFKIKPVRVTMNEYRKIRSLDNIKLEKIAFVMLVLAKINKQSYMFYLRDKIKNKLDNGVKKDDIDYKFKGYYLNESINEICKLAKVYGNKEKKLGMIKELWESGLIHVGFPARLRIDFVDNGTKDDFVVLDKFKNFILEYEKTIGVKVKYCEICGCIIKDVNNKIKYCKDCAKAKKRIQNLEWKQRKNKG